MSSAKNSQECFKCKSAGFPKVPITFEKVGENPQTGKALWKLIDPATGQEHRHRTPGSTSTPAPRRNGNGGMDEKRLQDIKDAQAERKKQHVEFIKNLQWNTKMLAYMAAQQSKDTAEEILDDIGFEEYREEQLEGDQ